MKQIFNSLIIAFAMYSKLPMPRAEWSKENMRYVMCFFPLVGAVIGTVIYLWSLLGGSMALSTVFLTVVYVLIPLFLTGGIHMDGFMDTTDALSSYQSKEKKLEILKDPNSGAFAVIACVGYYLLTFGAWFEISKETLPFLCIGFLLSRALSGLSVVTFPLAKNSGLAATFSNEAKKVLTKRVMLLYILLSAASMLLLNWKLGIICLAGALLTYVYYRQKAIKEFGGITGDLAGYFLQLCELIMAVGVILGGRLCG